MAHCSSIAQPHDSGLSWLLTAWLVAGSGCLLGPGVLTGLATGLGLDLSPLPALGTPDWIRHHAHAQIFGWIGSFIFGISLYAVPRLRNEPLCMRRAWSAYAFWLTGLSAYFAAPLAGYPELEITGLVLQSVGAAIVAAEILPLEIGAYARAHAAVPLIGVGVWTLVLALFLELMRMGAVVWPEVFPATPSRVTVLLVALWGGVATTTWGYASRWLPAVMNLRASHARSFRYLALMQSIAIVCFLVGLHAVAMAIVSIAAIWFVVALRVFEPLAGAPRTRGVHGSFAFFARLAHVWMVLAALLAFHDFAGGATAWPSTSRHLLTVGYLASMIAAVGPRMLPAFLVRVRLFSRALMGISMGAIACGVAIRVINMIAAATGHAPSPQSWFTLFAVLEVAGLLTFVLNGVATVLWVPTVQQSLQATARDTQADASTFAITQS